MNKIRRGLKKLINAQVSNRTAIVMAVCSSALLISLMVIWLGMSTNTALLDKRLEELDTKQTELTDEINRTWTEIGEVTSPREMEPRARRLGFAPATQIEYLVVTPEATSTVTETMTATATSTLTATVNMTR
jgi:hypothetical protein